MFPTRKAGYVLALLLTLLFGALLSATAQTATVSLIHAFDGSAEGASPGSLMLASDGNFYGTVSVGGDQSGASGHGTIFKMTPAGKLTTLYIFGSDSNGGYPFGFSPIGPLVEGADGSLYGVTANGGPSYNGTVFKITKGGALTTIYDFGPAFSYTQGASPRAGLVKGADGTLYGTTALGGSNPGSSGNGDGTVFQITPDGVHTKLHDFTDSEADGPGALTLGDDGALYGTASQNTNSQNFGSVFRVDPVAASKNPLTGFTQLKVFYNQYPNNDGYNPGGLVKDKNGDFYGVAGDGSGGLGGTVFKITPIGKFTDLARTPSRCSTLVLGKDGNFYGTEGGYTTPQDGGSLVRVTPTGSVQTLFSFPEYSSSDPTVGALGSNPSGALVTGPDGNFYGLADKGGLGYGTVFKAYVGLGTPPPAPRILPHGVVCVPTLDGQSFLVVSGTDFALSDPGNPSFTPGATVDGAFYAANIDASTSRQLVIALGKNFPAQTHQVVVTNPDGQTTNGASASVGHRVLQALYAHAAPNAQTAGALFHSYPFDPTAYLVRVTAEVLAQLQKVLNGILGFNLVIPGLSQAAPTQALLGGSPLLFPDNSVLAKGGGKFTALLNPNTSRVVAAGGGNVVAAGGGNVVAAGGGNVVAAGGGHVLAAVGGNIVAPTSAVALLQATQAASASAGLPFNGSLNTVENSDGANSLSFTDGSAAPAPSLRASAIGPRALASGQGLSLALTKSDDPSGGSGSSDAMLSALGTNGQSLLLLQLRFTPGQPDAVVYQSPALTLTPTGSTPPPIPLNFDVTGQVAVTRSPLIRDPQSHLLSQVLTLTNPGAQTVIGPLQVLLTGLPDGVTLTNAGGQLGAMPYVPATGGSLDAGQAVRVRVTFRNPSNARFGYAVKVYSGTF